MREEEEAIYPDSAAIAFLLFAFLLRIVDAAPRSSAGGRNPSVCFIGSVAPPPPAGLGGGMSGRVDGRRRLLVALRVSVRARGERSSPPTAERGELRDWMSAESEIMRIGMGELWQVMSSCSCRVEEGEGRVRGMLVDGMRGGVETDHVVLDGGVETSCEDKGEGWLRGQYRRLNEPPGR